MNNNDICKNISSLNKMSSFYSAAFVIFSVNLYSGWYNGTRSILLYYCINWLIKIMKLFYGVGRIYPYSLVVIPHNNISETTTTQQSMHFVDKIVCRLHGFRVKISNDFVTTQI